MAKRSRLRVSFGDTNSNFERNLYRAVLNRRMTEDEGEEFFVRSCKVAGDMGAAAGFIGAYTASFLFALFDENIQRLSVGWLIVGAFFFVMAVIRATNIDRDLEEFIEEE